MQALGTSGQFRNLSEVGQNFSNGTATVGKLIFVNTTGAAAFIQIFDAAAASVTIGTTRPLFSLPLAATTGYVELHFDYPGYNFSTRLSVFSTTTAEGSTGSASGVFGQGFAW